MTRFAHSRLDALGTAGVSIRSATAQGHRGHSWKRIHSDLSPTRAQADAAANIDAEVSR